MGAAVPWMVVVVCYARERDVDRQQEDSELDKGTDDLQTFEGNWKMYKAISIQARFWIVSLGVFAKKNLVF